MSAYRTCGGQWPRWCLALALAASAAFAIHGIARADGIPQAAANDPVIVHLDEAKIMRLPERTVTLVVGNPLIADVAVQPGGIMVITGKSYGATNLVALDRSGTTLMEHSLQVQGPRERVVFVHRGVDRESYSCTPNCERRIMLGDTPAYFTATIGQTGNLNTAAQGTQPK
jgi:Flp pilus assembly secretin CpaC